MDEEPDIDEIIQHLRKRRKKPLRCFYFWIHGLTKAFTKTTNHYGLQILLFGFIYTIIDIYIPENDREKKFKGFDMSFWITYLIPGFFALCFLIWQIFRAPYEIYREQWKEHRMDIEDKDADIERLENRLKELTEIKPFEVEPVIDVKRSRFFWRIRNQNQGSHDIRLKLINIDPPMKGPPEQENNQVPWPYGSPIYSSDDVNLGSAQFFLTDTDGILNQGETCKICVFIISKGPKTTSLLFDGKWLPGQHNRFIGEGEHILTFELLSHDFPMTQHKLKVTFSKDLEQGWIAEKIY